VTAAFAAKWRSVLSAMTRIRMTSISQIRLKNNPSNTPAAITMKGKIRAEFGNTLSIIPRFRMITAIRKGRPAGMKKENRLLAIVLLILRAGNLNLNFILLF